MKTPLLLRIAAVLILFFAAAHAYGHFATPSRGFTEDMLFKGLKSFTFDAMGSERTHWDFYTGYSLFLIVNLVVLGTLTWMLGGLAQRNAQAAHPFIVPLLLGAVLHAVLCWRFFFIAPAAVTTVYAVILAMAWAGSFMRDA